MTRASRTVTSTRFSRRGGCRDHRRGRCKPAAFDVSYVFGLSHCSSTCCLPAGCGCRWHGTPSRESGTTSIRTRRWTFATSCTGPSPRRTGTSCAVGDVEKTTTPRATLRHALVPINVAGLYGPGAKHVEWVGVKSPDVSALAAGCLWISPPRRTTCNRGLCTRHSCRSVIALRLRARQRLMDTHLPALFEDRNTSTVRSARGLQYGSFLQSKMATRGCCRTVTTRIRRD
jgi:hypothetical protein